MITTPEIICDLFSFLDKDQIERIQLVNQLWNNVIIRHKNILPLRQFRILDFDYRQKLIEIYATEEDESKNLGSYIIKFDGTDLSKIEENVSSRYSQLTVDEVLTNLNDVVFYYIRIQDFENSLDDLLNMMKLVTAKTGGRFHGKFGHCENGRVGSKLAEIFDNYIIVDELTLDYWQVFIRDVYANPEIVQLPSTPKEIGLIGLCFEENEEVLHFTCKFNGANRVTIEFNTPKSNYGNFIRQWFELYRTHENPISLVRKFELSSDYLASALDAVKTFLNNTQLRVKYSLETKALYCSSRGFTYWNLKRRCVLHETDSYALVIEMLYGRVIDISSINASDLDQPLCINMISISFCVKSL